MAYLFSSVSDLIQFRKPFYVELTDKDKTDFYEMSLCNVIVKGVAKRDGLSESLLIGDVRSVAISETFEDKGGYHYKDSGKFRGCFVQRIMSDK